MQDDASAGVESSDTALAEPSADMVVPAIITTLLDRVSLLEREVGRLEAERDALLENREALHDRIRALAARMRSTQNTAALTAIEQYHLSQGIVRRQRWRFWRR